MDDDFIDQACHAQRMRVRGHFSELIDQRRLSGPRKRLRNESPPRTLVYPDDGDRMSRVPQLLLPGEDRVRIARTLYDPTTKTDRLYTAEIRLVGPALDDQDANTRAKNAVLGDGERLCNFTINGRWKTNALTDDQTSIITAYVHFVGSAPHAYLDDDDDDDGGGAAAAVRGTRRGFLLFNKTLLTSNKREATLMLMCAQRRSAAAETHLPSFWIGSVLLQYFEQWVRHVRPNDHYELVVVYSVLESVRFYEQNGYERANPFFYEPRGMTQPMIRNIRYTQRSEPVTL